MHIVIQYQYIHRYRYSQYDVWPVWLVLVLVLLLYYYTILSSYVHMLLLPSNLLPHVTYYIRACAYIPIIVCTYSQLVRRYQLLLLDTYVLHMYTYMQVLYTVHTTALQHYSTTALQYQSTVHMYMIAIYGVQPAITSYKYKQHVYLYHVATCIGRQYLVSSQLYYQLLIVIVNSFYYCSYCLLYCLHQYQQYTRHQADDQQLTTIPILGSQLLATHSAPAQYYNMILQLCSYNYININIRCYA